MKSGQYIRQLLQVIHLYHLDRDPQIEQIKNMAESGELNDGLARGYLVQLQDRVDEFEANPDYLHQLPDADQLYTDGKPEIELGGAVDDPSLRVGINCARSVLIAGNSNSGKTTVMLGIIDGTEQIRQHSGQSTSQISFDRKSGDNAHLPQKYGSHWIHLSVHDPNTHLGLNNPPGVPPNVWINLIATIFAARAGLIAGWTCLANMIRWLLPFLNPTPNQELIWPSLSLILEVAKALPLTMFASKPDYEKSLIQALEAATQASHISHCGRGLDIERDIIQKGKSLVLDISNMAPSWLRRFYIDLLLAQPLYSRIHRQVKGDRAQAIFYLDEADQDVTPEADRDYPDQMSVLSQCLRWGRELMLMYVIGISRLNLASDFVRAEPTYHLIFNQSDAKSIRDARDTLLLPPGAEVMLPALKSGECIFRQAQSCWPHPMKVKIDYQPVRRAPQTRPYDQHPWLPAKKLEDLPQLQQVIDKIRRDERAKRLDKQSKNQPKSQTLSTLAGNLLHEAAKCEWLPLARLFEKMPEQPHFDTRKRVYEELQDAKLAEIEDVRIGRTKLALIRLTDEGWQYLHLNPPKRKLRGGVVHTRYAWWVHRVGIKRGYKSHLEYVVPGSSHTTDCAWLMGDGRWIYIEIAVTAFSNIDSHITGSFRDSSKVANLIFVVSQKGIAQKLQNQLNNSSTAQPYLDKIEVQTVDIYLEEAMQ